AGTPRGHPPPKTHPRTATGPNRADAAGSGHRSDTENSGEYAAGSDGQVNDSAPSGTDRSDDAAGDAARNAGDALDKAGDAVGDVARGAGDIVEDAGDAIGNAAQDAADAVEHAAGSGTRGTVSSSTPARG
ncbi:MAG: hypothetical protein LUF84_05615, partial [Clostridiales bacterium]|nr:hypothetical protein [Clostridiales bacterium]